MEDYNYYNDSRVRAGERAKWYKSLDTRRMCAKVDMYDEEDNEVEVEVPVVMEVCPTCGGHGTHVNPSIDAGGITSSEWEEWDEEDRDAYMDGRYDVTCYECGGKNVVPELDRERCDPKVLASLDKQAESRAESERESYYERMMGC
jgi:hypothetical protein